MKKRSQRGEVFYHIINSLLAGALVFIGAFSDGTITLTEVLISGGAALAVAIAKFKEYWGTQEDEYKRSLYFNFIG